MKVVIINLMTKHDHAYVNLGALYISSVIRNKGHEVKFIDLVRYLLNDKDIECAIRDFQPDIIAFSGIVTAYYQLEPLSRLLKKSFRNIPQLLGGTLGFSAIKTIETHTDIDFICAGEGEEMIIELLEELAGEKRWENVQNLYYRIKGCFKPSNKQHLYIDNLDSIPFPAYDLIDMEFYTRYTTSVFGKIHEIENKNPRVATIVGTRGCPFSCSFCYRVVRKWRHHSIENILEHLRILKNKYDINAVVFADELIFADPKWFISLCRALIDSGLGFTFSCGGGKPSLVSEELISVMKEAGFRRIGYGVESGSPKILKLMNKGVTREQNYHALNLTFKHGIDSMPGIVLGHPGENKHTLKETLSFIEDIQKLHEKYNLPHYRFQIWFATAYPGSSLYEYALSNRLIPNEREYLLKITSAMSYIINLSEFKSITAFMSIVYRGFALLDLKKFIRRKQYVLAFRELLKLICLYMLYFGTFGSCASFTDVKKRLNMPIKKAKPGRFREILRMTMDSERKN